MFIKIRLLGEDSGGEDSKYWQYENNYLLYKLIVDFLIIHNLDIIPESTCFDEIF